MRYAWLGLLLWGGLLSGSTQDSDSNVNTRYKVETVVVSANGWTTDFADGPTKKVSPGLGKRITALIGNQLNPPALDDIAKRLRRELNAATVSRKVTRGASPSYVKVVFEVGERKDHFDVSVPKFIYSAREGWSGAVEGIANVKQNAFAFGVVSDNDVLSERYAGMTARYENSRLGTDKVHFRFEFDSYHNQWNRNVEEALSAAPAVGEITSGIYRTRQNFEPAVVFSPVRSVSLSVGASFERFQEQFPAAHTGAANAVITDVRFHDQIEGSDTGQDLAAGYDLRAAARTLSSDYVYARHRFEARYALTHGKHAISDELTAGLMTGRAPLFERYVLGTSSTLRGWNRFDLDPLGGNRMIHNSVDYRYGPLEVFYDSGAVWDAGQPATVRHGIGVGLREGSFAMAVAFPVRNGRADPIFMMGMNY